MSISIKVTGQEDTDEYKAGQELKSLFEKSIPNDIEGDITIVSNITLFGQEVKDIDLVVFGKLGMGFKRKLKFRPKNENEYLNRNVYFSNFCFAVELKKHSLKDIQVGALNNILVTYNGKKHDVTYQSERQKYSLVRYLKNIDEVKASVWVSNFIWLKNVTSKELLELTNKGEHNILPKEFTLDWLLMLILSQSKPFEHTQSSNPYWASQSWKSAEVSFSRFEKAFELFERIKKNRLVASLS